MLPLKPLPLPTQPLTKPAGIVGGGDLIRMLQAGLAPDQPYAEYLRVLDLVVQAILKPAPNTQTSNYTLGLADLRGIVETNLAGANTLTVPKNAAVPFPVGSLITRITQIGAGQTTLTPDTGVTIRSRIGLKLAGQYAVATLYKRGTDEWVASGDLST